MAEKAFFIVFILALFAFGIKEVNLRGGAIRNCLIVFLFFSLLSLAFSKIRFRVYGARQEALIRFSFSALCFWFFFLPRLLLKRKKISRQCFFCF